MGQRFDDGFDDLSRGLAAATSRRQALKFLAASAAGAAISSIGLPEAWAEKCKPSGRKCASNRVCCSRNCERHGNARICGCPLGTGLELVCSGSGFNNCKCECPSGTELCNNQCFGVCTPPKTQRNPNSCACECPSGTQTCGDQCCLAEEECVNGTCQLLNLCQGSQQLCDVAFPCDDPTCICLNTTEGGHACTGADVPCQVDLPCSSTNDCPNGYFCARSCCAELFGFDTCQPHCGQQVTVESSAQGSTTLPTGS